MKITKTVTTTIEITPQEVGETMRSYGHGFLALFLAGLRAYRAAAKEIRAIEAEEREANNN